LRGFAPPFFLSAISADVASHFRASSSSRFFLERVSPHGGPALARFPDSASTIRADVRRWSRFPECAKRLLLIGRSIKSICNVLERVERPRTDPAHELLAVRRKDLTARAAAAGENFANTQRP
jgi:hypothetical protein